VKYKNPEKVRCFCIDFSLKRAILPEKVCAAAKEVLGRKLVVAEYFAILC